MPKKITAITLTNFRAYYGRFERIALSEGENLLIYGENGSGKSSLFKALYAYFRSSIEAVPFKLNRYDTTNSGEVRIQFSDYNIGTRSIIVGSEIEHFFGNVNSDNQVPFIQAAALINGFLDYTDLLKVYFHSDPRPNLFELIILSLLGNHVPVSSGGAYRIKPRWQHLQSQLIRQATRRTEWVHRTAKANLPRFEIQVRETLNEVFAQLNRLLASYFSNLNIELNYDLQPFDFNYGQRKADWHTIADLRLVVTKDGMPIYGDYNDFLNEARLSAIAICLYLASLLVNPTLIDVKILYLDDVFIGLDAGNRIPILNILRNEFADYQKFISTYDRHWFELAKKQFEVYDETAWSAIEIYVGNDIAAVGPINKPIVVRGESHLGKAIKYLHHRSSPDYPAAANYFRKALEEMIQEFVPKYELVDAESTQFADYKLTTVLNRTKKFLEKTGNSSREVNRIIGLLHNLLHPLSHHEISAPIYKAELIIIESAFQNLKAQLAAMDIPTRFNCCLEPGKLLKITFNEVLANYQSYYEIVLKEPLLLMRDNAGNLTLSLCKCHVDNCYGMDNGTPIPKFNPRKDNPVYNYLSLQDGINRIHNYLTATTGHAFVLPLDYVSQITYRDVNMNWTNLSTLIVPW